MRGSGGQDRHWAYERLKAAYDRDLVGFYVDQRRLMATTCPVFSPWIAGMPLLILLLAALAVMLVIGVIAGTIALVLVALLYVIGIRPWLIETFRARAIDMALVNEKNFQKLWNFGVFGIALREQPRTLIAGPKGNWKAFINRHLPDIETQVLDEEIAQAFQDGDSASRLLSDESDHDVGSRGPLTGEIFTGPLPQWDPPDQK